MTHGDVLHFVVCYDVPDDGRRRRIADCLIAYGARVQFSVFEMTLDRTLFDNLVQELKRQMAPDQDRVYLYPLCAACVGKACFLGLRSSEIWPGDEFVFVV